MLDWDDVTPDEFEEICYQILLKNGFRNLKWYGKSGHDRGRDIGADKVFEPIDTVSITERWIAQCKRYLSRPPSPLELEKSLTWCRAHGPDRVLFMVSNVLSANTKDWLENLENQYPFKIHLIEKLDLEGIIRKRNITVLGLSEEQIERIDDGDVLALVSRSHIHYVRGEYSSACDLLLEALKKMIERFAGLTGLQCPPMKSAHVKEFLKGVGIECDEIPLVFRYAGRDVDSSEAIALNGMVVLMLCRLGDNLKASPAQ